MTLLPASEPSGQPGQPCPTVVVMGVSGCGKTTLGQALARHYGLPYADADDFHSHANKDKMAAGNPLSDADRWPWLDAIGDWLDDRADGGAVASCSALRRDYRDRILRRAPTAVFCHLHGAESVVRERVDQRRGHFMPPALLHSQYETLEPLAGDEPGLRIDLALPVDGIVAEFAAWWARHGAKAR